MTLQVYWNNICLLNRLEESSIQDICKTHALENKFKFSYFGLGRKNSISQQLKEEIKQNKNACDILISTDTDVFHNPIYLPYFNGCIPKPETFITIPLVMVINTHLLHPNHIPSSYEELLRPEFEKKYTFGGIHNSAGQMLLKCIFDLWGVRTMKTFCNNALISNMPAQAFQRVITGDVPIAIVPTIFANRCGINGLKVVWPKEGAVGIPSYVYYKTTVDQSDQDLFKMHFLGSDFQQLLKDAGDILPSDSRVMPSELLQKNNCNMLLPSADALRVFDYEAFHKMAFSFDPRNRV